MKIAFFSDIHGNKYVLDDFFSQLYENTVDRIVFCGDVFGYYYHQEEILTYFRQLKKLDCLKGNHDQMFLDMLEGKLSVDFLCRRYGSSYSLARERVSKQNVAYLQSWPTMWKYAVDGLQIAAFHGSPDDPLSGRVYPDTLLSRLDCYAPYSHVILGHTHHKMSLRVADTLVLNPGSIGQQRDGKGNSFIIFDTIKKDFTFHLVTYDILALHREIELYDPGNARLTEVLYREK